MPNIAVRPLSISDMSVIAGWMSNTPLWQRYSLTEAKTRTDLGQALQRSDLLLVSDVDQEHGSACGLAWCIPKGAFGRSAYLRVLGVRADFAGQGIGAALLTQTEQVAAQYSGEMFLLVSDFNSDAQRFYQRNGYTHIGEIPGYVLPDVNELLYWKRI